VLNTKITTYRVSKYNAGPLIQRRSRVRRPRSIQEGSIHDEKRRHELESSQRNQINDIEDSYESKSYDDDEIREYHLLTDHESEHRVMWGPSRERALFKNIHQIVVAYDGSDEQKYTVKVASVLAEKYKAKLTLLHVCVDGERDHIKAPLNLEGVGQEWYPDLLAIEGDDVAKTVAAFILKNPDSLLIATKQKDDNETIRFGSVTHQLLELMNSPILILPNSYEFKLPLNILVPLSEDSSDYLALNKAINICEDFTGEINLFHVGEENRDKKIKQTMDTVDWQSVNHSDFSSSGDVLEAIEDFAKQHAINMVVMIKHRDGSQSETIGRLITQISCPAWVVYAE
jgi:nucleotide-binding universal stress UspA family protein